MKQRNKKIKFVKQKNNNKKQKRKIQLSKFFYQFAIYTRKKRSSGISIC